MGLPPPEALAFAARSTTLALARPAVRGVGGNLAVQAILVVSNGVLAQLLCPLLLDKLGVESAGDGDGSPARPPADDAASPPPPPGRPGDKTGEPAPQGAQSARGESGSVTVAAGVAVGANGAAMGVSYLYEVRSHAAPYAALSMTVFGVMTVVFMTLDPFRSQVEGLARG
ncbi:hypothetical protein CDD83_1686 [Cordyceps sp. RAO-2017]|nr:hypothetical protein CDD83_1686 [Cordyceps sp. RAO-2017]